MENTVLRLVLISCIYTHIEEAHMIADGLELSNDIDPLQLVLLEAEVN